MARNPTLVHHAYEAFGAVSDARVPLRRARDEAFTVCDVQAVARIDGWLETLDKLGAQLAHAMDCWSAPAADLIAVSAVAETQKTRQGAPAR